MCPRCQGIEAFMSLTVSINLIHLLIKKDRYTTFSFHVWEMHLLYQQYLPSIPKASFLHIKRIKNLYLNNKTTDGVYFQ